MELIERYLQAVKFWLPKSQKQDIIAELSEDLREQVEEREGELGRKLNESEVAELLKQRGRPVLVANQFRPQQQLIGPVLFPIYLFVLEVVGAFYLLPWALVWIGLRVAGALHPGQSVIASVGSFWTTFWPMAFSMVGSTTIIFAILERVQAKSGFLEKWDPRKLPPVRDPNRIPVFNSVVEVVANLVLWSWLIGGLWYQTVFHFYGLSITLAPAWRYIFVGFLLVSAVNTVVAAVNLFHPYWTVLRASVRFVCDGIGSVLFCWFMKANLVLAISVTNVAPEKLVQIASSINWWMAKTFPIALVMGVLTAFGDGYRICRARSNHDAGITLSAATGIR